MPKKQPIVTSLAALFVASAAGVFGIADAAGLGRINVLSRMGQPFVAEIDLINVNKEELSTLNASLAPSSAYQAANIKFDSALNALRLSVQRRANGTAYIRATSWRPVNEPYLDLMIDVSSDSGKFRRQYAALLDMPTAAETATAATTAAATTAPAGKAAAVASRATDGLGASQANAEPKASLTQGKQRKQRTAKSGRSAKAKDVAAGPALTMPAMPGMAGKNSATPGAAVAAAAAPTQKLDATNADRTEATKGDAAKTGPATADAGKATPSTSVTPVEPAKGDAKDASDAPTPDVSAPKTESTPVVRPQPMQPAPPRATPPTPPAPPPGSGIMDTLMKYGVWIVGALLALLLALAGFFGLGALRRRRQAREDGDDREESYQQFEPSVDTSTQGAPTADVAATSAASTPSVATALVAPVVPEPLTVTTVTGLVDPVDEAKVYVNYGQFVQAEKVLRNAMSQEPGREAIQMALLELLSKRGNKDGFNQIAARLHKETGGVGDNWKRAAALGYELDRTHLLYSPPSGAVRAEVLTATPYQAPLDADQILANPRAGLDPVAPPIAPLSEFNIVLPPADTPAGEKAAVVSTASTEQTDMTLDFKVELPTPHSTPSIPVAQAIDAVIEFVPVSVSAPAPVPVRVPTPAPIKDDVALAFTGELPAIATAQRVAPVAPQPTNDNSLEFNIEPAVAETTAQATPAVAEAAAVAKAEVVEDFVEKEMLRSTKLRQVVAVKDDQWYDVQQKFDLIRAYQEMGDNEGVKEVLNEIEREGDAGQKAEAQKILATVDKPRQ